MKQKEERQIRKRKIVIAIMEYLVILGCLITLFVMLTPKEKLTGKANSYAKPEKVSEYRIVNEYMTRIRPLTEYGEFVEIAKSTMIIGIASVMQKLYGDIQKINISI